MYHINPSRAPLTPHRLDFKGTSSLDRRRTTDITRNVLNRLIRAIFGETKTKAEKTKSPVILLLQRRNCP